MLVGGWSWCPLWLLVAWSFVSGAGPWTCSTSAASSTSSPFSSCVSSSPPSPSRDSQILHCDLGCLVCDPPFGVGKWIRLWGRRNVPSWYLDGSSCVCVCGSACVCVAIWHSSEEIDECPALRIWGLRLDVEGQMKDSWNSNGW